VFATVNIADSQHAKDLTETANRDSRAMKQVSSLVFVRCINIYDNITDLVVSAFRMQLSDIC
jgi:hypothetical protein